MKSIKTKKAIVIAMALVGVLINASYGIGLLKQFFDAQIGGEVKQIIISAIALELGWAALLVWVVFKPLERRHILLFTAAAMLIGNLLTNMQQVMFAGGTVKSVTLNLLGGLIFAGLFVLAFFAGKPAAGYGLENQTHPMDLQNSK